MAPPELARDAPRLYVAHPLVVRFRPILRHELGAAIFYRRDRRLRQLTRINVPLIGQHRLDHDAGAVAERLLDFLILDLKQQPLRLDVGHYLFARLKAIEAAIFRRHVFGVGHAALRIHQHEKFDAVSARDLVVVEIMRPGDLHRA